MALHILTYDESVERTHHMIADAPGRTTPLFLGSKLTGESMTLELAVVGTDFAAAMTELDTIVTDWKAGTLPTEVVSLIGSAEPERLSVSRRPEAITQKLSMTVRLY